MCIREKDYIMRAIWILVVGLAVSGCSVIHTAIGSFIGNVGADVIKEKELFSEKKGKQPKIEE